MKSLIFIILLPLSVHAQKRGHFWLKQATVAAASFTAGWLHGTNEVSTHDYRRYAARHPNANPQWANPRLSFRNKYENWPTDKRPAYFGSTSLLAWTTDAYHLRSTARNALMAGSMGVSLTLWEKPNWKQVTVQALSSWAMFAIGTGAAHAYYKRVP